MATSPTSAVESLSPPLAPSPPKDVARECQREIQNLRSQDEVIIMKAAASIVMLATLPDAESFLQQAASQLVSLLQGNHSVHVQRNACGALTALMNASPVLYQSVVTTPLLGAGILNCLRADDGDEGLQINASAAVSILAQSDEGLELIREVAVEDALISLLSHSNNVKIEEAVVDAVCALAVDEKFRPCLLQKGMIAKLASCLGSDSMEICVRALLALGMLCGSSPEGQAELVEADGAVAALLSLMKSNDPDIRSISRDLFGSLSTNQQIRLQVEKLIRNHVEC